MRRWPDFVYLSTRVAKRAWVRRMRARRLSVGACRTCGLAVSQNPRTGKPHLECFEHRVKSAQAAQRRYVPKNRDTATVTIRRDA